MEITSNTNLSREDKGKMVAAEPEITNVSDLTSTDSNKIIEALVYRKWVSKHNQTRQPTKFCCILLDKQGTPIQVDVADTEYFNQLLELGATYRISGFSCAKTPSWERTLRNDTSLIFGKYLQAHNIPNDNFPQHYFDFAAYNELPGRANVKDAVLTDYIGRIRAISGIYTFGDATSQRKQRRIIDIENLSGNIIGLALWNEMAMEFDMQTYDSLPKPVVIAVSSCWVSRYNGLQLSATSATHYYLNPNIPETLHIKQQNEQSTDTTPFLIINNQRYEDPNLERTRNRFPLATLLKINPQNYQHVRFTSEATIFRINTQNEWYYQRCSICGKKVIPEVPIAKCKNHGPQPTAIYSYSFKAIVSDGSATTSITCFSNQANTLIRDVHEVLAELADKNPYHIPECLRQLEGTTHTFQFHFDTLSTSRRPDFVLDTVFQDAPLPLPAPPAPVLELPPPPIAEPSTPLPSPSTLPQVQPQDLQHWSPIPPKQIPLQVANPLSPTLSTTESNEPEVTETDITPKTTPPPNEFAPETKKETKRKDPPQPSARKALFTSKPATETSDNTKKAKSQDPKTDA